MKWSKKGSEFIKRRDSLERQIAEWVLMAEICFGKSSNAQGATLEDTPEAQHFFQYYVYRSPQRERRVDITIGHDEWKLFVTIESPAGSFRFEDDGRIKSSLRAAIAEALRHV